MADSQPVHSSGREEIPRDYVSVHEEVFAPGLELQRSVGPKHVAQWLRLPVERVLELAATAELPGRLVDGSWHFGIATLNLWIEGRALSAGVSGSGGLIFELTQELQRIQQQLKDLEVAIRAPVPDVVVTDGEDRDTLSVRHKATLDDVERGYILHVLEQCQGNKTQTANRLELDPSTLHRKLARYGA